MGIYNEILAARYARMVQKLFSMKGPAPTKQLAGEIMAVLPLFHGREDRYLEGWNSFGFFNNPAAAGVGNVNHMQLRNPPTSGAIAIIEKISFTSGAQDTPVMTQGPVSLDLTAFSGAALRFDPRGNPAPALNLSTFAGVVSDLGSGRYISSVAANTNLDVIVTDVQEIPLLPGDGIRLRQTTTNTPCTFVFWWRERTLEDSEKA